MIDEAISYAVDQLRDGGISATSDPRETGNGDYLDSFPRLNGEIRNFPKPE